MRGIVVGMGCAVLRRLLGDAARRSVAGSGGASSTAARQQAEERCNASQCLDLPFSHEPNHPDTTHSSHDSKPHAILSRSLPTRLVLRKHEGVDPPFVREGPHIRLDALAVHVAGVGVADVLRTPQRIRRAVGSAREREERERGK